MYSPGDTIKYLIQNLSNGEEDVKNDICFLVFLHCV